MMLFIASFPLIAPFLFIKKTRQLPIRFAVWTATLGRNNDTISILAKMHVNGIAAKCRPMILQDARRQLNRHLGQGHQVGFSDFFEQFLSGRGRASGGFDNFGRTGAAGMGGRTFAQRGHDLENDILVTLEEALHGSTRMIRLERTDPRGGQPVSQTLRVTIPAGVHQGQMIRLAGKGQDGVGGGGSGNLYLRVVFAQHPDFQVRGADLYLNLDLSPWEAVLGATVPVPTLDGDVSLKIPADTAAKRRFRLRGKGLPDGDGARGDLYAIISLQTPTQSTPEQKALWESLAAISTFNPRKTL
jgi:curved DNA-binding protein